MAQRARTDPAGERLWAYRRDVGAAARQRLWDPSLAEDVVQESLLRAFRDAETIDEARQGAWLTAVARRLAVDEFRRRQRVETRAEPVERCRPDADPAVIVERQELLRQVNAAVRRLPDRQRRLLLRQVMGGLSMEQLAADERTSVASVRSVLARARTALRASLQDTGWLVAGSITRAVTTVENGIGRLLLGRSPVSPRAPGLSRDSSDALTALLAAVALVFAPSVAPPPAPPAAAPSAAEVTTAPTPPAAVPVAPVGLVDTGGVRLPSPEELSRPVPTLPSAVDDDEAQKTIPFAETDGEIVQFAVAPDEKTVLASGGWAETPTSAANRSDPKDWEPALYRSEDAGHRWQRVRAPGFRPGRVLFAPAWPTDQRVFVITDDGVLRSLDGGRTFSLVEPAAHDPQTVLPVVTTTSDDKTGMVIRSGQRPAPPILRPGVLSPRFSDGDERIFLGAPAAVFDVRVGTTEPLASLPPWVRSRGVAPAPDHATSGAVLVGGTVRSGPSSELAALFRCAGRECTKLHVFDDISDPPGVFVSASDPGVVYVWTTYGSHRSTDGGRTWQPQRLGPLVDLVEVDHRLVFLSHSGVPISDDRGATWQQLHVVYSVSAVAPVGDKHLLLASGLGMACSPDGGDTWQTRCT